MAEVIRRNRKIKDTNNDEGPVEVQVTLKFKTRNDYDIFRMFAIAERHTEEEHANSMIYELMESLGNSEIRFECMIDQTSWEQEKKKEEEMLAQ